MPVVTVHGPAINDLDRKREMVKAMTKAASGGFGIAEEKIVVLLRETAPENVSVGGKLIVDLRKEG